MQITLSPARGLPGQPQTSLSVAGDVLHVDGTAYDLGPVPEGGLATPQGDHPFLDEITRTGGEIHCHVQVILDATAAPHQPGSPWVLSVSDGPVTLPATRITERPE